MSRRSCICFIALMATVTLGAEPFEVEQNDTGVVVKQGGKLVTNYLVKSEAKPILWPIIGPTGEEMTRAFPMKEVEGEKKDHPHHRSLWFTHGKVNGVDFWSETKGHGNTEHKKFTVVKGGEKAIIGTQNDWVDMTGKKILEDERRIVIARGADDALLIDFNIVLRATAGEATFGETKEGSFGIRVPTVMDVDAKKGGKIVNSEGESDADAWGKKASWVDYNGAITNDRVGIAILNHPSSFRYPTRWHVRTYGLFAANPWGTHDFTAGKESGGEYLLPANESLTLRYRVVFHRGDEKDGKIAEYFKQYSAEKVELGADLRPGKSN